MPLRRHEALRSLSRDHHLALLLARGLQKNAAPLLRAQLPETPEALAAHVTRVFRDELTRHFATEDSVLRPAIVGKDADLDRLAGELETEHEALEDCIERLAETRDPQQVEAILDTFGTLLEAHVRKEERTFYQRIQEVLDPATLEQLGGMLERHLQQSAQR